MKKIKRKILTTALLAGMASAAQAASYPEKMVTIVVPTPPGGGTDTIARMFADYLSKELGQTFVIENKPGANGQVGTQHVARGPSDGYRLLFTYTAAMVVAPVMFKTPPFDPIQDFSPIAQIGQGGNIMLVRKDLPVNSIQEFVAYAKHNPGKLNYCSWGAGSGGHLTMEILMQQAGIEMTHIPYKGSAACNQDLLAGEIDANWSDVTTSIPFVQAERAKAMVTSSPDRLPQLPDVPTMNEAGFKFDTYSWYGIFAPTKTSPDIVRKLNEAIQKALQDPAVRQRMHEFNFLNLPLTTPESFKETVVQDLASWKNVIDEIGLTLD